MILTNKLRLPEPIVRAIANDSYTKGDADVSVTGLLNPPQIRALQIAHAHELTEDASERIWSLLGQAVHAIIERAGTEADELSEVTLTTEYLGWKIKGTFDHVTLSNSELNDFKVTTAWKIMYDKAPPEWVAQTNIYRRMLQKEKGLSVNSIAIIAILRDWSKLEAARREDYPQTQVVRLAIPLWTEAQTDAYIEDRIRLHQQNPPQPCSDADVWAKPSKWAVVKKGNTRALKLFDDELQALAFSELTAGSRVEHRPGVATRCQSYCPVSKFCLQWAADPRRPRAVDLADALFSI